MAIKKKNKRNLLSTVLDFQIERFIGLLEVYNKKLPHPRNKKIYPFLRHFYKQFIIDQNKRALEISTPLYQKIKILANEQFPVKTLWNLCIDGRVLGILMHGASAGVGRSVRVPGGMLREFVRGKNGKLMLEKSSDFAMLLKRALEKSQNDIVTEVFDSHIACATRLDEENLKGKYPKDSGLLADVSHKMQMAQAAISYVQEVFNGEKTLLVIQTSFDPHRGSLYMGLETQDALLYVYKNGNAYTPEVLEKLTELGKIISTEELVSEKEIEEVFEKYKFSLSWEKKYIKSAKLFWESISAMKKTLTPFIEKKLLRIYPKLYKNDKITKIEMEERTMLILTNAFSLYLHNHLYPHGQHKEEGVKVGESGYPPYNISTFSVFSFEEKDLPNSIQLATSLVRTNRKESRVLDNSRNFDDSISFAQAPVPIIVLEIVWDTLSDKEWQKLQSIDWKDMPENWDTMTEDAFLDYLSNKGILQLGVGIAINNLRRKLSVMYEIHSPISSRLIEQYSVALPVITSGNRKIRLVIPFVKLGFI